MIFVPAKSTRNFMCRNGMYEKDLFTHGPVVLSVILSALAADNMNAFPPAAEGMVRHVLQLPKQDDESDYKEGLIVGKMVHDEGNRYFFTGKIEEETINGWGFPRYNVSTLGQMAGTLMANDPNAPKVNRFITLCGE